MAKHHAVVDAAAPVTDVNVADAAIPESILHTAELWIAVSFLLFAILFIRYVLPHITKALDDRSAKIRDQLEQASRLREQAQELLASYKAERESKTAEAEAILINAKQEAQNMRAQAEEDLKQMLERRSQQAIAKIERAEQEATAEIRRRMIDIASAAAAETVQTQLAAGQEDPAIKTALSAIERQIH